MTPGGGITYLQAQQGQGANPLFWGPEIQFARSLYAAGVRDVMIIKGSRGGGGNTWWFKNAGNPQMYQHLVTIVGQAVAALPPGDTFEIVGFLYLQGESDDSTEANISGSRLATLIGNLRQDLPQAARMHAVIGGIATAGATRDIVRAQQAALAAGDPTIDYFSTLDLQGNLYDNLHFDKPAKRILGDRYAQAFLAGPVFAATPVISEVMAVNTTTLVDENGDASDWIEIWNPGFGAVDLSGYRLTDDAGDNAKWVFPPGVSLTAREGRVVFCSGKDRAPSPGELHTNFDLPADGGYLALYNATGALLQAFSPAMPQMFTDRSFGSPAPATTNLVAQGHPVRVAVPLDGSLGTTWVQPGFDDSDPLLWRPGVTGVGYESGLPPPLASGSFAYAYEFDGTDTLVGPGDPLPENIDNYSPAGADWFVGAGAPGTTATNGSIQHVATSSGNWWEVNPVWNSVGITSASGYTIELRVRITAGSGPAQKVMGVLGGPLASTTSGTFLNLAEDEVIWRTTVLPLGSGDNTDAMHVFRVAQRPGEETFLVWRDDVLIGQDLAGGHDSFPGRMILGDIGAAWTGAADIDSFRFTPGAFSPPGASAPPPHPLYSGLIGADTSDAMFGDAPSAYLRIPFELVADPAAVESLRLGMRYDDGFVAWLNGVEIARRNAPANPAWNDPAPGGRDDRLAVFREDIDVSAALGTLVRGTNLLAVQALNQSAAATRFLALPGLQATFATPARAPLASPTPGAENAAGLSALEAWRAAYFSPRNGWMTPCPGWPPIPMATAGAMPSSSPRSPTPAPPPPPRPGPSPSNPTRRAG